MIMNKNFIKVRTGKDVFIFISCIVVGICAIILPTGPAVNIAAAMLVLLGLIMAPLLKNGYKEELSGEEYLKKEHFFPLDMKHELLGRVASKLETLDLSQKDKGTTLRLDIYHSKSAGKAYVQLMEYVPHQYNPCADMVEYDIDKVKRLI